MRLGHAHLKVRNLDRSLAFYAGIVGLKVTERIGDDFLFLVFGAEHHDLALQALGDDALRDLVSRLKAAGLPAAGADYGISQAVYTQDPDGHGVEFYRDTRADTGRALKL